MGTLRNKASGDAFLLRARHLVGRAVGVDLQIDRADVSREHATISWNGTSWEIRDLGSSNGTWVDGMRLDAGRTRAIATGQEVRFGLSPEGWELAKDTAPTLSATSGGQQVEASDGLLCLPNADAPEAVVHEEAEGWVVEQDGDTRHVQDRAILRAGGRSWHLHVPRAGAKTIAAATIDTGISATRLSFGVSADEEYVELTVHTGGDSHKLPSRAHHYLLLTLARARLQDAADGGSDTEHGWLYTTDLQKMLRASSNQIYVSIHRARKELEKLGIAGATEVVERRTTSRQVRIGVGFLEVYAL